MDILPTVLAAALALPVGVVVGVALARRNARVAADAAVAADRLRLTSEQQQALTRHADEHQKLIAKHADEHQKAVARLAADHLAQVGKAKSELEAALTSDRVALAADRTAVDETLARAERREDKAAQRDLAIGEREKAIGEREKAIDAKHQAADQREARLRERDDGLSKRATELDARDALINERSASIETRLSDIAGMTAEQAKAELLAKLDLELATEQAARISRFEKDLATRTKDLAVEHISRAIQRYAAEHTAETTATRIALPNEEAKGRIIGREGRNIKAFEQATGVDVIIDDQADSIQISCFDPVRRELARRTLVTLLDDGRIQPARIEEVLLKVQQDMDRELFKLGEDAAYAVEVSGLHPQLIKLLGKLHFRTSYGQNVLKHTQEVAFLCAAMAADLGLDAKLGRRCGLMHDIGKAIDHEQEGSHPQLGYDALKRYGESEIVANAALAHHEGHAPISAYTVIAAAADAISAARPGARSHNTENYLKRLTQLETIACSRQGVQKAYAIQAGRELRVIVNGHSIADGDMAKVARDIAKQIEEQVAYPGEVKVTLIREMRQIAMAR